MFLLNSRPGRLSATASGYLGAKALSPYYGSPSPEVTGTFCRVPWRGLSRAPVDTLLAHLWRFPVRSPTLRAIPFGTDSVRAFLGSLGSPLRRAKATRSRQASHSFKMTHSTVAADDHRRVGSLGGVPHPWWRRSVGPECRPAAHRLRRTASA